MASTLGSDFPLFLPEATGLPAQGRKPPGVESDAESDAESGTKLDIEVTARSAAFFTAAVGDQELKRGSVLSFRYAHLQDRSSYVRWDDLGEFLVGGDGRGIACRRFAGAELESFQVYLLGQALSFALVKRGLEPLHATAVVIDGQAVAFIGSSGFGKSSLAASFLAAGHSLLTDDQLLLREQIGETLAYPGPARIKLFPPMARRFLGEPVEPPSP